MPAILNSKSKYAPFSDCPEPLREFLSYILTIRGLSPRTVDGYYIELRTFLRFLKLYRADQLNPEDFAKTPIIDISAEIICGIKLADVYAYLNFAHSELGNAASARARKVSALSSFYKFLSTKTLYMTDNPIKNLDRPSIKRALPKYLTLDESNELLETVDLSDSARDYCMLTLFLNCGMRLSELVAINRSDIRDDNTLKLLGKGNKERIVYLNQACLEAIHTYIEDSKKVKRQNDALFVGKNGRRLSPRRVEQIIGECLKSAGLSGKGYTPHKLRHTAATLMYQYGNVDVRILKEILGHANLNTTELYTHISNRQLEQAADSSPLAQKKRVRKAKTDDTSEE